MQSLVYSKAIIEEFTKDPQDMSEEEAVALHTAFFNKYSKKQVPAFPIAQVVPVLGPKEENKSLSGAGAEAPDSVETLMAEYTVLDNYSALDREISKQGRTKKKKEQPKTNADPSTVEPKPESTKAIPNNPEPMPAPPQILEPAVDGVVLTGAPSSAAQPQAEVAKENKREENKVDGTDAFEIPIPRLPAPPEVKEPTVVEEKHERPVVEAKVEAPASKSETLIIPSSEPHESPVSAAPNPPPAAELPPKS